MIDGRGYCLRHAIDHLGYEGQKIIDEDASYRGATPVYKHYDDGYGQG